MRIRAPSSLNLSGAKSASRNQTTAFTEAFLNLNKFLVEVILLASNRCGRSHRLLMRRLLFLHCQVLFTILDLVERTVTTIAGISSIGQIAFYYLIRVLLIASLFSFRLLKHVGVLGFSWSISIALRTRPLWGAFAIYGTHMRTGMLGFLRLGVHH